MKATLAGEHEELIDKDAQAEAIRRMEQLRDEIAKLAAHRDSDKSTWPGIQAWDKTACLVLEAIGMDEAVDDIKANSETELRAYTTNVALAKKRQDKIESWIHLAKQFGDIYFPKQKRSGQKSHLTPLEIVRQVCGRFDANVRALSRRYNSRAGFAIMDEYDVQDLLKALLKTYFENVVAEDPTGKTLDKSSRIDVVLPSVKIAIEVKITSDKKDAKKLGQELQDDIVRYQKHPDCKTLICFVYDPNVIIDNPRLFEEDLNKYGGPALTVDTIVCQPGHSHIKAVY